MSEELTTAEITKYFESRIENINRSVLGVHHGKEPQYPMLIILLGGEAIEGCDAMRHNLAQVWPQFEDDLLFLGVRMVEENQLSYARVAREGEIPLTLDDVAGITDELAASENFSNESELLPVYYVLQTTSLSNGDEFDAWVDVIQTIKDDLYIYEDDLINEMMFVLLDESGPKRRAALRLRNAICEYCEGGPHCSFRIVLLSNRQKGGKLDTTWDNCHRICTSLIELSNNEDTQISDLLFADGVVTVSYVHDEKPIRDVGQVVVEELFQFLAEDNDDSAYVSTLAGEDLAQRLGLTRDGTLQILDEYVDSVLVPKLPTDEEINLFPRWIGEDYGDVSGYTAEELDDLTMGTWSAYLDRVVASGLERVRTDVQQREKWVQEYRSMLNDEFKVGELIYLADHLDDVASVFHGVREPTKNGSAREYAKRMLRCMLSSDETIVKLFLDAIRQQAEQSREFRKVWDVLHSSRLRLQEVRDKNLVVFYRQKVQTFLDRQGLALRKGFRDVASTQALHAFLRDTVDDVIESDAVFTASYEDEQESRLSRDANAQSARNYIRQKLSGDSMRTYLRVNSSLGGEVLNAVLLKMGTKLASNLKSDLSSTTYFYDTGYGNGVEVLSVHEVSSNNLISRGGR